MKEIASLEERLNEPIVDNLGASQVHIRNPLYEAEIEDLKAEMKEHGELVEVVNAKQKEILRILAHLCNQPQSTT
jgi:hypothetical protein